MMDHEKHLAFDNDSIRFLTPDKQVMHEQDRMVFLCPFGSHLYGTDGPESDLDLKGIYMAPMEDIVLETAEETKRFSTGDTDVCDQGDLDVELIELRKFLKDALNGQTYAVELLHCPDELKLFQSPVWWSLLTNRAKLLSEDMKPFVGYCEAQARKYSMKGARLAELERVLDLMREYSEQDDVKSLLTDLDLDSLDHVDVIEKTIRGQEEKATLLKVGQKKYDFHSPVKRARKSLQKEVDKYGDRAHRAKDGIDWKAIYHAYRVAFELKELLKTGSIEFPLDKSDFLRKVKLGKIPYKQADREIPQLVEEVTDMEIELADQFDQDEEFWDRFIIDTYL